MVQQLRQDLVGKQLGLRIAVGGTACFQTQGLSFATTRLVDTEIDKSVDSGVDAVRYYMRVDRFINLRQCTQPVEFIQDYKGIYLNLEQMQYIHQPGTAMTVKQVEAKADRIEIQLTEAHVEGDAACEKLKLILSRDYPSQSLEQIKGFLNTAFKLPRIDAIVSARQTYDSHAADAPFHAPQRIPGTL